MLQRASGRLGFTYRLVAVLWSRTGGQRGPRFNGDEQLLGIGLTCVGGSESNSGAYEAGVGDGGLGEVPGHGAELLRWSGLATVRRSGGSMVAQWLCFGAEKAEVALGCRGGGSVAR